MTGDPLKAGKAASTMLMDDVQNTIKHLDGPVDESMVLREEEVMPDNERVARNLRLVKIRKALYVCKLAYRVSTSRHTPIRALVHTRAHLHMYKTLRMRSDLIAPYS